MAAGCGVPHTADVATWEDLDDEIALAFTAKRVFSS